MIKRKRGDVKIWRDKITIKIFNRETREGKTRGINSSYDEIEKEQEKRKNNRNWWGKKGERKMIKINSEGGWMKKSERTEKN